MKVFVVLRNDKIDQVFLSKDHERAAEAAEARARELNQKWAITQVVEQAVTVVPAGPVLADVPAKLAYEWVRTGHWGLKKFTAWLDAKHIAYTTPIVLDNGKKVGRPGAQLAYEWIRSKHWGRRAFQTWLNHLL